MMMLCKILTISAASILATSMVANAALPPSQFNPAAPSDLHAVVMPNFVQINWIDNSSNESRFQVNISQGNGAQSFTVAATPGIGTRTALNITNLVPGTYTYSVCAKLPTTVACRGIGIFFNQFTIPGSTLAAPTNPTFSRVGASTARIFWNHPGGATSFRVRVRLPGSTTWTLAATVPGNVRQADIAPLFINTVYPVQVCAQNSATDICSSSINVVLPQGF